jgi:hypothetical protein
LPKLRKNQPLKIRQNLPNLQNLQKLDTCNLPDSLRQFFLPVTGLV